jgi:predicted dehydrogenase
MSPFSRRTLLAGGAASLALADTAPIRLPAKVRLGIIGLVGHTSEITGPLASLPDVELVAVADPDRAGCTRLAAGARFPAATIYDDYRAMLNREKLDMVGVCNDNGARAAAVLACAERKVHVIAEKPLAVNRADFERVRSAVAANGIKLSMLLPMRFAPQFAAMRRIVQSGEIGEVAQIESQKSYRTQNWEKWKSRYASYGSTILWIGPHSVDLMRHIGGREMVEAVSFQAHIGAPQLGEMENSTGTLFRLDNGGVGVMRLDYLRPDAAPTHEDDRLRIAGTKGVLEYQASTGLTVVTDTRKPEVIRDLPPQKPLFVDFLESVYLGTSPALDLASIYRVNEIVLAADESARQPRIVKA